MKKIFYNLIDNTFLSTTDNLTEEQAINYLKLLTNKQFIYHNDNNYDAIDYEKLIYIEINFSNNQTVQELLIILKKYIASNYLFKKKYLKRIKTNIFNDYSSYCDKKALKNVYYLPEE